MKKIGGLLVLFLFSFQVHCQNWTPFPLKQKSFFQYEVNGVSFVDRFSVELVSIEDQDYFFLNSRSDKLNSCFDRYFYGDYKLGRSNDEITDYYKFQNDSIVFYNAKEILLENSQDYLARTFSSLIIKPYAKVGDSWQVGNCKVECIEAKVGLVLGLEDSIKVFNYFGTGLEMKLRLSKSYGILEFNLVNDFYIAHNHYFNLTEQKNINKYQLIGLTNDQLSMGYRQPDFSDYFNLKVGDVVFWKYYPHNGAEYNFELEPYTVTREIANSTLDKNKVVYAVIQKEYSSAGELMSTTNFSEEYSRDKEGVFLSGQPNWFNVQDYQFENEFISFVSCKIEITNEDTLTTSGFYFSGADIRSVDGVCIYETDVVDYWHGKYFSTRYGFIGYGPGAEVVGGIIDGETYGSTDLLTANKQLNASPKIDIYPNPVSDDLCIASRKGSILKVEIFDVCNRPVLRGTNATALNLRFLNPGVYFVKVFEDKGAASVFKIIKQ